MKKNSFKFLIILCMYLFISEMGKAGNIVIGNSYFKYVINEKGENISFIDNNTGIDYLKKNIKSYCAKITQNNKEYSVTDVSFQTDLLTLAFKPTDVEVKIKLTKFSRTSIIWEVVSIKGNPEILTFANVPLILEGMPNESFGTCLLAMNLATYVDQLPPLQTHLQATCYKRFGIEKAKVAMIGISTKKMISSIKSVMISNKDIPYSTEGGAWAQTAKGGHNSYLMNFGTLTDSTVDDWIKACKDLGFNQIDNHGGNKNFFKFGDFELNQKNWPGGWDDFKEINKKLHDAGIASSLHTYSFFIDTDSKYVTPIPNKDLAYNKVFTLTQDISTDATKLAVGDSIADISLNASFFSNDSKIFRIGDELIEVDSITKTPPFKFLNCKRGALGTKQSMHKVNEKIYRLRTHYNRFIPDPKSSLFTEIAKNTAEIVNKADFDGIYFDALDNLAGADDFWYYSSMFVVEVFKYLKKPVPFEMSGMQHLFWNYRSRWQAWDRPIRGYQRFIDIHSALIKANGNVKGIATGYSPIIDKIASEEYGCLMLPLHLGWWAYNPWGPPQIEATFIDDIEYLTSKMIGNNAGLSMTNRMDKKELDEHPQYRRFNALIKQSEELRNKNYFSNSVRAILRQPGKNFKLIQKNSKEWAFLPIAYQKHKVSGTKDEESYRWSVNNEYKSQPLKLRIEALMSVKSYNDSSNIAIGDVSANTTFSKQNAKCISGDFKLTPEKSTYAKQVIEFTANGNGNLSREGSWFLVEKKFNPELNINNNQGLGVWVYGDGNDELLNIRLQSPDWIAHGAKGDHFIKIDFTGWRYFELVEIESEKYNDYIWPEPYRVDTSFEGQISFPHINKIQFWYNNIPTNKSVRILLTEVKALPLVTDEIKNPTITINGEKIIFPITMKSGMFLEFQSATDCKLYGNKGEFLQNVSVLGNVPTFKAGNNKVSFNCDNSLNINPRLQISIISEGNSLNNK